jgi:hypothetical protein
MFGRLPRASPEIVEKFRELCASVGATLEEGSLAFNLAVNEMFDPLKNPEGELWVFDCDIPREPVSGNDLAGLNLAPPRLSIAPPADCACNLVSAYRQHALDLRAVQEILAEQPSIEVLHRICINQHDWAAFWACRGANAEMRERSQIELMEWKIGLRMIGERVGRLIDKQRRAG